MEHRNRNEKKSYDDCRTGSERRSRSENCRDEKNESKNEYRNEYDDCRKGECDR